MNETTYIPCLGDKANVRPAPSGDPKRPRLIPWPPTANPPRYLRSDGEFTRVRMDDYLMDIWRQGDLIVEPISQLEKTGGHGGHPTALGTPPSAGVPRSTPKPPKGGD